jgi:hypothetical protein
MNTLLRRFQGERVGYDAVGIVGVEAITAMVPEPM